MRAAMAAPWVRESSAASPPVRSSAAPLPTARPRRRLIIRRLRVITRRLRLLTDRRRPRPALAMRSSRPAVIGVSVKFGSKARVIAGGPFKSVRNAAVSDKSGFNRPASKAGRFVFRPSRMLGDLASRATRARQFGLSISRWQRRLHEMRRRSMPERHSADSRARGPPFVLSLYAHPSPPDRADGR
jgi:hypothetical protein